MAVDQDLYSLMTFLVTPTPVQQDTIDIGVAFTRVWFQRSGLDPELYLDKSSAGIAETYDVECMSETISTAQALAQQIISGLNGYRGMLGFTPVCSVFVSNQSDDYIPKNQFAKDQGFHVCAIKLKIMY